MRPLKGLTTAVGGEIGGSGTCECNLALCLYPLTWGQLFIVI